MFNLDVVYLLPFTYASYFLLIIFSNVKNALPIFENINTYYHAIL